jgi:DNA-binding CsgD family transcriptional regulator
MSIKSFLHNLFSPRPEVDLSPEASQCLQSLAEREGLSPEEVAWRLIEDALDQCETADTAQGRWNLLTRREQQIAVLVCRGYSNQQIAAELFISPETVKNHQRHILMKLGLNRKAALREAFKGFDFPPIATE